MKNLLDDVLGYSLDVEQRKVVYDNSKHAIVIAGAGSGKTLTIIGKIRYLIEKKNIRENEILCISFTREASLSLKKKLKDYYNYEIEVYTFHKLALEIIKECTNTNINVTPSNLLEYIAEEYFYSLIKNNDKNMKRLLQYFGYYKFKNIQKNYDKFLKTNKKEITILIKNTIRFIRLFKGKNLDTSDFYKFYLENSKKYWFRTKRKNALFLQITYDIYLLYQEEIKSTGSIDFDDMIILATEYVSKTYNKKYQYIIIDEYQDTNLIRFNLIIEILKKTNANFLVVGDDFQSIYGFTGCNLSIFLDFTKYFENASIYKITNTYRNSQELVNIAGKFIMKNNCQIKKNLKSLKHLKYPIEVCYESSKRVLKKLLIKLKNTDILIIARNSFDIYPYLDDELVMDKDGTIHYNNIDNIRFLTVHKSKGLESDNIILIHVINDTLGFPNTTKNSKVFNFLLDNASLLDEERRLFYVALTRTKNKVYILSDNKKPSIFLSELTHDLKTITYNEL